MKIKVGDRFGRLTVVKDSGKRNYCRVIMWECLCECGNTTIVRTSSLNNGTTKSCGCYNLEVRKTCPKTHGMYQSRIYSIWRNMLSRCRNKNNSAFSYYGDKGINVCDSWEKFENFYEWAVKNGYNDDLTIDRIDGSKGYNPENCRWVSRKIQQNNLCNNIRLMHNGIEKTISDWADELNINKSTLRARLKYGWSIYRALTEAIHSKSECADALAML